MATNPMQRQARNSFLLGMVITLLIAGVIVGFLYMQIKKLNEQIKAEQVANISVYVLKQDVKSGQVLTSDLFEQRTVKASGVPADATSDISTLIKNYSLCDKSGNDIYTKADGTLFMKPDGTTETRVYQEETTGNYYTQTENGTKTYIETTQKPLIAKIDMKTNTVIASSYISRSDDLKTADVRQQEYNMIVLPTDLVTGDFVDVRLMLPTGQDFIVVAKKEVTVPAVNGQYSADTIQMNLAEEEILAMSNAVVEAYKIQGSKLYITKYAEAGMQEAATPTYVVNEEVAKLIETDSNIVSEAMVALRARYNANDGALKNMRSQYIKGALSDYGDDDNVESKMEESITSTQEQREEYLQTLPVTQ